MRKVCSGSAGMKGWFTASLFDKGGGLLRCEKFTNTYTKAARNAQLRSLLQTTATPHLGSTHYAKLLAFCTSDYPGTPADSDLGTVQAYESLSVLSDITIESSKCTGTRQATFSNTTGGLVTIKYIATTYGSNVAKNQVFQMANIGLYGVPNGGGLVIDYVWEFQYDISFSGGIPTS